MSLYLPLAVFTQKILFYKKEDKKIGLDLEKRQAQERRKQQIDQSPVLHSTGKVQVGSSHVLEYPLPLPRRVVEDIIKDLRDYTSYSYNVYVQLVLFILLPRRHKAIPVSLFA